MKVFISRFEIRTTLIYLVVAALWIIASDAAVAQLLAENPALLDSVNIFKGLGFVIVTAAALFSLLSTESWKRNQLYASLRSEVHEHRQTEASLRIANRLYQVLSDSNQALIRATDENELFQTLCNVLVERGGYRLAWIGYAEQDGDQKPVRVASSAGDENGYLRSILVTWDDSLSGQGPTGIAIRTGHPSTSRFILTDPRYALWRPEAVRRGYASSIALPLKADGHIFGALNVYASVEDAFDTTETALLTELAADIGYGVQALRTAHDNERRRRALEQERQINPVGITIVGPGGRMEYANAQAERILGLKVEDIVRHTYNDPEWHITDLDGQPFPEERLPFTRVMQTRQPVYGVQHAIQWPDGRRVLLDINATPVLDGDGSVREVVATLQDMTETYQRSRQLRESEERYRLLVNSLKDYAVFMMDTEGLITSWNTGAEQITGFSSAEIIGQHFSIMYPPEDREAGIPEQLLARATAEGIVSDQAWRVRKDGSLYWAEVYIAAMYDDNGRLTGFSRISRDLTAQRQAEEQIRYQANLIESVSDAIVATDMQFVIRSWNQAAEKLYGWSASEAIGQPIDSVIPTTYPETDRDAVLHAFQQTGQWRGEVIHPHRDGRPIHIMSAVALTYDSGGQPMGAVAINRDVTERKRAEQALKLLNQRLSVLHQIDSEIIKARSLEAISESVLNHLRSLVGCEVASIRLTDEDEATSTIFALSGDMVTGLEVNHRVPLSITGELEILKSGQVLHVPDLTQITGALEAAATAAVQMGVRASLTAPLLIQDHLIGMLSMASVKPDYFSEAHIDIVSEIAAQLAIAIQNTRLLQTIQAKNEQLQQVSARLVEAQEAERRHIARELHDEIGQTLTALNLMLDLHARQLPAETDIPELREAQTLVGDLTRRIRELSLDLRPSMLDDLGLISALVWFFRRYEQQTRIQIDFRHSDLSQRLSPMIESTLYRIIQEALTNIARHAKVERASVRLWKSDGSVFAQIEDSGAGFDLEAVEAQRKTGGVPGMRERAEIAGGSFGIESSPGAGTIISVSIPLQTEG